MYALVIPKDVKVSLESAEKLSSSIGDRLLQLQSNPLLKAIETNIACIGNYYVNAGRWCILFDINEDDSTVEILSVVLSPKLHKILSGKISP